MPILEKLLRMSYYRFRIWMTTQSEVRHHLLVGKFVPFRAVDDSVQYEHVTVCLAETDMCTKTNDATVLEIL